MQCQCNQDNGSPLWFQTLLRQRGIRPTSLGGPSSRFLIFSPRWQSRVNPWDRLSYSVPGPECFGSLNKNALVLIIINIMVYQ